MSELKSDQPVVLVSEGLDAAPMAWLRDRARVREVAPDHPDFPATLREAEALIVRTYTRVTEALLAGAPRLRVVARAGVGLDNVDVAACRARGVEVVYSPDANSVAVGDYVFGTMLRLVRDWHFLRAGAYDPKDFKRIRNSLRGRQLNEMTLGILGMGRVGRRVGHIAASGFGMRVIYNDLLDVAAQLDFDATPVDKPTLFRESDVLTIHVDFRRGNEHLVGAPQIALMKPSAILINSSRGEVLDANAVAAALHDKKLSAAAIDVYDPEPPPSDFVLLGTENAQLTPHLASRTNSAVENMSWVVKDVINVLNGQPPKYPAP